MAILFVLLSACATIQDPPGGPPDLTPPVLVSVTPDSGAVVPGLKDPVVFRFNEVVSERPGASLDQMVVLSPRPRQIEVGWHRTEITVKPRDGWRPGVAYRVALLPGIADLRSNKLPTGKTVVFSTGGDIPRTRISGRVIDWEAGGPAARALVEAISPDSLIYWDVADSTGAFTMIAVPPGRYVFAATLDRNTNRRRDYREPFDSTVITLDSSSSYTFWAFTHDSVGPRIRAVSRSDSVTVRIEFNQVLAQQPPDTSNISVRQLPDSAPVALTTILSLAAYDSMQAAARSAARVDSTASKQPPAGAPAPRPGGVQPAPPGGPARVGAPGPAPVDTVLARMLREKGKLSGSVILRTAVPLLPGQRYVIRARVSNPSGAIGETTSLLVVPAADTTRKAR